MDKFETCEDCGHQISQTALSCPNCGCPTNVLANGPEQEQIDITSKTGNSEELEFDLEKRNRSANRIENIGCAVIAVIAIAIVWIFVGSIGDSSDENWREKDNSIGAYVMMQTFVKRRLKSPATADFASYRESTVLRISGQTYVVKSYVDSQNGFGANIRTNFRGTIEKTGPETWRLEDLDL